MRLYEATGPNVNLLLELSDIFFENFYKDDYDHPDKYYLIENPFPDNEDRIDEFLANNSEFIKQQLFELEFHLAPKNSYKFDDDGEEIPAAATYNKHNNVITFYGVENITQNVLVHELRHLIQFATYADNKKLKHDKNYREKPVEIDAYWTDSFIDAVTYGVPDATKKDQIINVAKFTMKKFNEKIPNLSDKYKKHYYRKTIKGLVDLDTLIHKGYEPSVKNLKKFTAAIDKKDEMQKLLDKVHTKGSFDAIDKLSRSKNMSFKKIEGYDITKEPKYAITSLGPPNTLLPRNMNAFQISHAVLYLMLIDRKDILKVFLNAVKNTPRHKHNKLDKHDIILSASQIAKDEDNQLAIQKFMLNHINANEIV